MTRVGVDVSSTAQWRTLLARTPAVRISAFAPAERAWCGDEPGSYALAWAVKEAAAKLIGSGFEGIGWHGVWSRPAGAAGIEVVLDADARNAPGARGVHGPFGCAVRHDGDHVIVVLVAGGGEVAVRALRIDPAGDRRARHRASRWAARRAGSLAADALAPHPGDEVTWVTAPDQAPTAVWPDGTTAPASFSHGRGLVCAAVAQRQDGRSSETGLSASQIFGTVTRSIQVEVMCRSTDDEGEMLCPSATRAP